MEGDKAQGGQRRPLRVLVVEDDPDTAATTALLLQLQKYDVFVAPDGATALRLAAAEPPDVALLDFKLPDFDGGEVARRLQAAYPDRKILLIAVSGSIREQDRARIRAAGIQLHLAKPAPPDVLLAILKRYDDGRA